MVLDDIIDFVLDIPSNIGEFIADAFENIGEFSITGVIFGFANVGIILLLKKWILDPFTQYMGSGEGLFWTILTFVISFILGYFMGNYFENSS